MANVSPAPSLKRLSGADSHDLLMCDICLESYDDKDHEPKFLSCHHSFCYTCLNQLPRSAPSSIECPTCRHATQIGEVGIGTLQTNFYLAYMRETLHKLGAPKTKGCQKHSNQPMSFFCQKCGVSICRDCTVLDHKESEGHGIQDIAQAETEQRKVLKEKMLVGKDALSKLQAQMQNLEAEVGNLTIAKEVALNELDHVFDRCIKMLEFRKLQLAKTIFDLYNKKQESLLKLGEDVSIAMKHLSAPVTQCERLVKVGHLGEIVTVNRSIVKSVEDSKKSLRQIDLGKNYLTYDSITGMKSLEESICHLGNISSDGYLPIYAKFESEKLIACLPSTVVLQVFSHSNEKLSKYPITIHIIDPKNTYIQSKMIATEDGEYRITFLPQMSGDHRLVAAFLGHPIKGAETTVKVRSNNPIQKLGEQGKGNGKFLSPRAVAVDTDGSLFIADTGNRLIQKLDKEGNFTQQFYINNNKDNCSTCDLALNIKKGLIICTETIIGVGINPTMGNNVLVYNREGVIQDVFTNKVMKCALCIATNSRGEIIVSDYLVHSLFIYDAAGKFIRRVGNAGTFNHPAFICIAEDDSIIVSDTNNDCVQIFDSEGNFSLQFGSSGPGKGELKQPFGVATDGEYILVVDSGNKRIQLFKTDGTFVSMIESKEDPLDQPRGLAVTDDGHFYVADRDNHTLKKFKYKIK